jgi:outer membrane protein assembly factor BamB
MKRAIALFSVVGLLFSATICVTAADWPQWRGLNRASKATDFKAPQSWPEQLTPKWKVSVGEGDSSPSLVDGRLYVFSRQDGQEIIRCLNADNGEEIWQDKYSSEGADGGARQHSGPRASPTVAAGKVVTLGVRGMLSCLNAETGKVLWRKDDFESWPMFFTASSPIVVDGLCIAQLGGNDNGAVVAYDLNNGEEKWKWPGGAPSHASPVQMTLDGRKLVIAQVTGKLVALDASNGELAWETANGSAGGGFGRGGFGPGRGFGSGGRRGGPEGGGERREPDAKSDAGALNRRQSDALFAQPQPERGPGRRGPGGRGPGGRGGRGGGRDRFATTPIVDGQTIIYAGPGGTIKAARLDRDGDKITSKEQWSNSENGLAFNSPILKDGLLFGLTGSEQLFCIDAQTGKTAWKAERDSGGGFGGYGSIVDAGSVLLAMTPKSELIVFKPTPQEYTELARIKLSEAQTFAHLVAAGNRLFLKDRDSVAMLTLD